MPYKHSKETKMTSEITLVDLDNIFIINDVPSASILLSRIEMLKKTYNTIIWFGNSFTQNFLKQHNIHVHPLKVSKNEKDASDHKIVKWVEESLSWQNIQVITGDKTLQRLVYFKCSSNKNIKFRKFVKHHDTLRTIRNVDICFKTRAALQKFINSYNLYKTSKA